MTTLLQKLSSRYTRPFHCIRRLSNIWQPYCKHFTVDILKPFVVHEGCEIFDNLIKFWKKLPAESATNLQNKGLSPFSEDGQAAYHVRRSQLYYLSSFRPKWKSNKNKLTPTVTLKSTCRLRSIVYNPILPFKVVKQHTTFEDPSIILSQVIDRKSTGAQNNLIASATLKSGSRSTTLPLKLVMQHTKFEDPNLILSQVIVWKPKCIRIS